MVMNKTEKKCHKWIKEKYKVVDDDIFRISTKSPDFILKNGERIECKKIYGKNKLVLRVKQFRQLLEHNNTIIAVFDGGDVPLYEIPINELKEGENWKHLSVSWIGEMTFNKTISLDDEANRIWVKRFGGYSQKFSKWICKKLEEDVLESMTASEKKELIKKKKKEIELEIIKLDKELELIKIKGDSS